MNPNRHCFLNAIRLWCLCLVTVASLRPVLAQEGFPKVILDGKGIAVGLRWSADSKQILFLLDGTRENKSTTAPSAVYDLDSQSLQTKPQWAFLQPWTPAQITAFAPAQFPIGAFGMTFKSPDGKKIVYAKAAVTGERRLAIAFLDSNTSVDYDIDLLQSAERVTSSLQVAWSADSNSVVVVPRRYKDIPQIYYLTGINSGNVTVIELDNDLAIGPYKYSGVYRPLVLDISADGSAVALRMYKLDESGYAGVDDTKYYLVLWKPNAPSTSTVIPELNLPTISAVTFAGSNGERLVYIDSNGLYSMDIATKQSRFITSELTSVGYEPYSEDLSSPLPYFSPDGQWVVMATQPEVSATLYDLRPYNLNAVPLQPTPACSPAPATYRTWRLTNANADPVNFGWMLTNGGIDAGQQHCNQ